MASAHAQQINFKFKLPPTHVIFFWKKSDKRIYFSICPIMWYGKTVTAIIADMYITLLVKNSTGLLYHTGTLKNVQSKKR